MSFLKVTQGSSTDTVSLVQLAAHGDGDQCSARQLSAELYEVGGRGGFLKGDGSMSFGNQCLRVVSAAQWVFSQSYNIHIPEGLVEIPWQLWRLVVWRHLTSEFVEGGDEMSSWESLHID